MCTEQNTKLEHTEMWILSHAGANIFLSFAVSRPAFFATQPFTPKPMAALFLGIKRPRL
jgi:hypothetical protein